jgi:hypothetical protein
MQQFTATGTYTDNSTQDLTNQVTWASATTSVATIHTAGLATAIATGTSKISATWNGVTGSTTLTVTAAALESIAVTPANPTIAKGLTQQFAARGTYSDTTTQDLTTQVTWASMTTSVATINTAGLATAVATGTSEISATLSGVTGSTVLTVSAATLELIAVTPANPSIAKGLIQQFTAKEVYSDNSTQDLTNQVTWASATTSVAAINTAGLATAIAMGTSKISATWNGLTGSTVLAVTAAALQSIAVTPANPTIAKGLTQQFTATGTYSDSSTQNLTGQVTWTSSDTSVASVTAAGLATGTAPGTAAITAMLDGHSASTMLVVTTQILPPPPPLLVTLTSVQTLKNKKHQVIRIILGFSGAVDAMEAQAPGIYRMVIAGKHQTFTAKNARVIKLKSARINAADNLVTLTPRKAFRLTKPVQLRVNGQTPGGLEDRFGRVIDGDRDGQPGGNAVVVLRRSGVTAAVVAGKAQEGRAAIRPAIVDAVLERESADR